MSRTTLLISFLLCLATFLYAQSPSLLEFNQDRLQRQRTAMLVLGTWAVGNIASGAALRGRHTGAERQFHNMNIYWNLVNLGLATAGYLSAGKDPASFDLFETMQAHQSFQKTLLFNAGLDVGYVLGGLYLIERSRRGTKNADTFKGFGRSVVLQGAFLFGFDLVNYFIEAGFTEQLRVFLPPSGPGVGMMLNL